MQFNLEFMYKGSLVQRFHTMQTLKSQNIAEHSFGVAWLCEWLTDGEASKDLILAALAHDLAEQIVGDIPAPAKRALGIREMVGHREAVILRNNNLSYEDRLTGTELGVLKIADALDGMVFCVRECKLGNSNMREVFKRFETYVKEVAKNVPCDGRVELILNKVNKFMEE